MKIIENITNGYRKIASGIAIVAFLTLMYFALIPGGTMALSSVTAVSGDPIIGAFVKLVDYPQYNATTDGLGNYNILNVPYDALAGGSTYKLRASAAGYGSNSTDVTLTAGSPNPVVNWELYPSDPRYIPYLDDRGTTYESFIQIFNPYSFNITADINEYSLLTGLNTKETFEIPVNTLGSRNADKVAGGVDFIGTAKVENTRPQSLVQGVIRTLSTGIYSIAPSRKIPAETVQYLPYMDDRSTTYDSGIQIFNPYDVPLTVNLTAYNIMNGLTSTLPPFDIPAKSFASRYAGDVAGGAVGSNVDFIGTIKVETSQPAPVQGNLRTRSTMTSSMAPALSIPTVTVQYLPYLDDRDTRWDSGVQIFNPYDVNITVTLTAINMLNSLTTSLPPFEIPAKSFASRYAGDVAGGAVGSNVDFVGTIKVETSQPALVQGNLRTRSTMTTSLAPALAIPTSTVQYIPYLDDQGATYDSGVQIYNPNSVPISVTLTAYNNLTGITTTLPPFSVPAMSFGSRYAGDVAGGAVGSNVNFVGTIKVETSLPAPVQGNIRVLSSSTTSIAAAKVLE